MSPDQSGLSLRVTEEGDSVVVRFAPGTTLSGANSERLAAELAALAAREPRPHLLIDLGGVNMLTSLVLAKLIGLNNELRAAGGRLTIANARPVVREVFKVTRLDTLLDVAV
jgi:anti-anti-sigma factor